MAKFKSAYFLIAGLLFILDQTNAGRGRGRSGGGRCEGDSACEQTVLINNNSHHNNGASWPRCTLLSYALYYDMF